MLHCQIYPKPSTRGKHTPNTSPPKGREGAQGFPTLQLCSAAHRSIPLGESQESPSSNTPKSSLFCSPES